MEKGRFRWPEAAGQEAKVTLSHEELMQLLGGIDLTQTRRRAWHRVTGGYRWRSVEENGSEGFDYFPAPDCSFRSAFAGRFKPKNASPFQRVPVTATAIALSEV